MTWISEELLLRVSSSSRLDVVQTVPVYHPSSAPVAIPIETCPGEQLFVHATWAQPAGVSNLNK